jgi:hypothetical protein
MPNDSTGSTDYILRRHRIAQLGQPVHLPAHMVEHISSLSDGIVLGLGEIAGGDQIVHRPGPSLPF